MRMLARRQVLKSSAAFGLGLSFAFSEAFGAGDGSRDGKGAKQSYAALRKRLRGVHNFLTTPFLPDYTLDTKGLRQNVAHHARAGVGDMTIVVGGGLGELFTLDTDEQKAMAEAAVAGAQGRLPVVVGAGGGYGAALRMARNAEQVGADAVLLFSSPYGSDDPEGAYRYFKDVADAVKIGVILYPRGKEEHWPETIRRLAETPNVIGFKDASGEIAVGKSLGTLVPDDFLWIAEGEEHAVKALPAGARAYTSAVAVFAPEACRQFWESGVGGRLDQMNAVLQKKINPVVALRQVSPGYGISAIKVGLEALGRAGGPVRPPGANVRLEDRERIAEIARKYSERD
ncbi:MAG: dihydrodipicolinate synthase family protein [Acidobacteria bacterium]|nr:dihydrodipicolinate synthase family protein [Acidobacteriota bacterium]